MKTKSALSNSQSNSDALNSIFGEGCCFFTFQVSGFKGWMSSQIGHVSTLDSNTMIPIIGARSEKHLKDNLGCLDFELTDEQIQRLNDSSPIDLGFPHSFLASDHVRGLIFGETFSKISI